MLGSDASIPKGPKLSTFLRLIQFNAENLDNEKIGVGARFRIHTILEASIDSGSRPAESVRLAISADLATDLTLASKRQS